MLLVCCRYVIIVPSLCFYQYDEHLPGEFAQVLLTDREVFQVGEGQQLVKIIFMLIEVMKMIMVMMAIRVIMVLIEMMLTWGRGS